MGAFNVICICDLCLQKNGIIRGNAMMARTSKIGVSEVFGCIPHGAGAYRFSRVERVERGEVLGQD